MKKIFSLLMVSGILIYTATAQNVPINIPEGTSLSGKLISNQTITMMGMEMQVNMESDFQVKILNLKDSLMEFEVMITKIKSGTLGMGKSDSYNSETGEGENSELGKELKELLNKPDTTLINRYTGQLAGVKALFQEAGDVSNIGGGSVSNIHENIFMPFPAVAKKGDTWKSSLNSEGVKSDTEYHLRDLFETTGTLDYSTVISGSMDTEVEGVMMTTLIVGTANGEIIADNSGLIQKRTADTKTTASMELGGQPMEVTADGTTIITLLKQ